MARLVGVAIVGLMLMIPVALFVDAMGWDRYMACFTVPMWLGNAALMLRNVARAVHSAQERAGQGNSPPKE